jgi:hypothetical protein
MYCGCPGGGTPICCYVTVVMIAPGVSVPGKNGFCKGEVLPADACPEPPCSMYTPPGQLYRREAKCMNEQPL